MSLEVFRGKTALVTGASSGIGLEMARLLAESGCHVVLSARRRDRLERLAEELHEKHRVEATVVTADLAKREGAEELLAALAEKKIHIDILVNNAGLGWHGSFAAMAPEKVSELLEVNVVGLVALTRALVGPMVSRKSGWILHVGSLVSYMPVPFFAIYAATKAFVLSFSQAVAYELNGTGVRMSVLCPGMTYTEFHDVAGAKLSWSQKLTAKDARPVAAYGLRMLARGCRSGLPGWINTVAVFFTRFVLRRMLTAIAGRFARGQG